MKIARDLGQCAPKSKPKKISTQHAVMKAFATPNILRASDLSPIFSASSFSVKTSYTACPKPRTDRIGIPYLNIHTAYALLSGCHYLLCFVRYVGYGHVACCNPCRGSPRACPLVCTQPHHFFRPRFSRIRSFRNNSAVCLPIAFIGVSF